MQLKKNLFLFVGLLAMVLVITVIYHIVEDTANARITNMLLFSFVEAVLLRIGLSWLETGGDKISQSYVDHQSGRRTIFISMGFSILVALFIAISSVAFIEFLL